MSEKDLYFQALILNRNRPEGRKRSNVQAGKSLVQSVEQIMVI